MVGTLKISSMICGLFVCGMLVTTGLAPQGPGGDPELAVERAVPDFALRSSARPRRHARNVVASTSALPLSGTFVGGPWLMTWEAFIAMLKAVLLACAKCACSAA